MSFYKLILLFLLVVVSCKNAPITTPEVLDDGWEVSTPQAEGFDREKLNAAINEFAGKNDGLNSLLIARNGKLVVDEYYNDYSVNSLHKIWSVTKPITATLVGIAQDKGYLNINDSLGNYFQLDSTSAKTAIKVVHLLVMVSGLEWIEMGGPQSQGFKMAYTDDWVDFILQQPMIHEPGEVYTYSTGNTVLLAPILQKATGKPVNELADEVLFHPLGITNYEWDQHSDFWKTTAGDELPGAKKPEQPITYKQDYINTGSGLRMRTRDVAKIAQLYLNNGVWDNQQLVSKSWIQEATTPNMYEKENGYCWSISPDASYFYKTGFGGQQVIVFPKLGLLMVITQSNYRNMDEAGRLTNQLIEGVLNSLNP